MLRYLSHIYMEQNDFREILRKYLNGDASPEEKKLIDEWYVLIAKDADDHDITHDSEPELFGWAGINSHVKKSKKKDKLRKLLPWYAAGMAASLLLMIVSSVFFNEDSVTDRKVLTNTSEASITWRDIVNTTKITQVVALPDSSKVDLEPEGKLKFSSTFNKTEREVFLEGEAFFDVSHNPNIPFIVHANEVTTKVLGTSFIIKALKHEQRITVAVKTGRVSVFASLDKQEKSQEGKEIILTPNQQIVYDKKEKEISRMLVKTPHAILPDEEVRRMRFEEAPVSEIFKALEKTYGVDIVFDEELFSACRLTTVISKNDLYGRLNIICSVIGTSYTLEDDRIVISSSKQKCTR
jgi:transmembrane sensor